MPTTKAVPILSPMWKSQIEPILFTRKIRRPPKIELPIIFKIDLIGNIKNLPNKNKKIIQEI